MFAMIERIGQSGDKMLTAADRVTGMIDDLSAVGQMHTRLQRYESGAKLLDKQKQLTEKYGMSMEELKQITLA